MLLRPMFTTSRYLLSAPTFQEIPGNPVKKIKNMVTTSEIMLERATEELDQDFQDRALSASQPASQPGSEPVNQTDSQSVCQSAHKTGVGRDTTSIVVYFFYAMAITFSPLGPKSPFSPLDP